MNKGQDRLKNSAPSLAFLPLENRLFLVVVEGYFPFIFSPRLDGTEWRETSHGAEVMRVRLLVEAGVSVVSRMVTVGR